MDYSLLSAGRTAHLKIVAVALAFSMSLSSSASTPEPPTSRPLRSKPMASSSRRVSQRKVQARRPPQFGERGNHTLEAVLGAPMVWGEPRPAIVTRMALRNAGVRPVEALQNSAGLRAKIFSGKSRYRKQSADPTSKVGYARLRPSRKAAYRRRWAAAIRAFPSAVLGPVDNREIGSGAFLPRSAWRMVGPCRFRRRLGRSPLPQRRAVAGKADRPHDRARGAHTARGIPADHVAMRAEPVAVCSQRHQASWSSFISATTRSLARSEHSETPARGRSAFNLMHERHQRPHVGLANIPGSGRHPPPWLDALRSPVVHQSDRGPVFYGITAPGLSGSGWSSSIAAGRSRPGTALVGTVAAELTNSTPAAIRLRPATCTRVPAGKKCSSVRTPWTFGLRSSWGRHRPFSDPRATRPFIDAPDFHLLVPPVPARRQRRAGLTRYGAVGARFARPGSRCRLLMLLLLQGERQEMVI